MDFKVEVRDYHNSRRLLGHIKNPPKSFGSSYLEFCTCPKLSVTAFSSDPPESVEVERVELTITWEFENNGYMKRAVFQTSVPLETLMKLENFRLPGETDDAAAWRRYNG